jgi:hypothetical protein
MYLLKFLCVTYIHVYVHLTRVCISECVISALMYGNLLVLCVQYMQILFVVYIVNVDYRCVASKRVHKVNVRMCVHVCVCICR